MRKEIRYALLVGASALAFGGCDTTSDELPPGGGGDEVIEGTEWEPIDHAEDGAGAGTDGFDFGDARPTGEARLGRHPDDIQLFGGGDARCRPGDYVLENDYIRTCVSGALSADAFFATGGYIVDMVPTSNPGYDELETYATALGFRTVGGDEFRVVNDGSDGGPAVLRVSGVDVPLKLTVGTLGTDALAGPINVKADIEYRLAPDAQYLEIVTWVMLDGNRAPSLKSGTVALLGDLVRSWVTGIGEGRPSAPYDYMALIGSEYTWGFYAPGAKPQGGMELLSDSLYLEYNVSGRLGNQSDAAYRRYLTVVDRGSSDDIEQALSAVREAAPGSRVSVQFTAETVIGWEDPVWSLERLSGDGSSEAVAFLRFGDGALTDDFALEPGDYRAVPVGWPTETPVTPEFTVSGEGESVTLPRPALRPVSLRIVDEHNEPIPAMIRYWGGDGGYAEIFHVPGVVDEMPVVEVGSFSVEISSGETRAMSRQSLTTSDTEVRATLAEQVDREGWIVVDFHQHSQRSADTSVANVDRVLGNLAKGLDVIVPTDHDVVENYPQIVRDLGLEEELYVFSGTEISPLLGHFNMFPVRYDPSLDAFGAGRLAERLGPRTFRQRTPNEIATELLSQGAQLIQLNHGRGATFSLMDYTGYDHITDQPTKNEDKWLPHFDTMELFNRSAVFCWLYRDWQAMLQHGKRITAVSNSDTHDFVDVGYPRNYVYLGADADNLSDQAIVDGLRSMAVSVSGGILVRWSDYLPGDVIPVTGPLSVDVLIEVPDWSFADHVTVFLNGVPYMEEPLNLSGSSAALRATTLTIDLNDLDRDSTLSVLAWSNDSIGFVIPGKRPWGLVNPLFLDVDGDGWEGGGSEAAAAVRVPQGISYCTENPAEDKSLPTQAPHEHHENLGAFGWTHGMRYVESAVRPD